MQQTYPLELLSFILYLIFSELNLKVAQVSQMVSHTRDLVTDPQRT